MSDSNPWQRYQRSLSDHGYSPDPAQEAAVQRLQDLFDRLADREQQDRGWMRRVSRRFAGQRPPERGLYLWGGVGRGKTWLMDNFCECLPPERRFRVHFHRFMQRVHAELGELAGEKNPLRSVAERIAGETDVICFDEFFVSDIADAMILANLLEALFGRGITLVATSNIAPRGLYENGLQRARFLPAIALLETHTEVVNVDGGVDYRLRTLESAELYHHPLDEAAEGSLDDSFSRLALDAGRVDAAIEINGRPLRARRVSDDVVWFDFAELCDGPRSQNDYIELAREFHAVLLSGVPQMDARSDDQCRRFVNLVDEFYDRNVKLVIAAAAPPKALYSGSRLAFEFQRTVSRLVEMQSHDYLALEHRP